MKQKFYVSSVYIGLALISFTILSSCSAVRSSVQVYHQENLHLKGKSYAFSPIKKLKQQDDLAYDFYSGIIAQYLNDYGMHKVSARKAQILVKYYYYIGEPSEVDRNIPIIGQTGISSSSTSGYFSSFGTFNAETTYNPSYGVVGSWEKRSYLYPYYLLLNIYYRNNLLRGDQKPVYQVVVKTVRKKQQPMMKILPYMINALFYDFPGTNGSIRSIKVKLDATNS